jgi:menaquinone-dependent protoporphyrinogen oxidase
MPGKMLITYASKGGSTGEIAEAIGEAVRAAGVDADVMAVQDVSDLASYTAVVIGAPIYAGRLLKAARTFAQKHAHDLAGRRVFAFVVGMSLKEPTAENIKNADKALSVITDRVTVQEVGYFAGKFDIRNVPFIGLFSRKEPEDARDWDAIRSWGAHIADVMQREA